MKKLLGTPLKVLGFLTILLGLFLTALFLTLSLLGPFVIAVGLFIYFLDTILKLLASDQQKFRTAQIVFSVLYLSLCVWLFLKIIEHNSIIFPTDFQGEAGIIFGIEGFPPLPKKSFGKNIIEIPENGILITSTKAEEIPQRTRFHFQNDWSPNFDRINWQPGFEIDCILNDSKIKAWVFTIDNVENAIVRNKVTELCNQIIEGQTKSFYKDNSPTRFKSYSGTTLSLQDKRLTSLPNAVSKLNISKAILTGNNFTEFPKPILENKNIEEIIIAANPVQTLPAEITNLNHLKSLTVSKTEISEINVDLSKMTALEDFDISYNSLKSVPEQIKNIPNLLELRLNNNNLENISFIDKRLSKLESLDLYSNNITELSKETEYLSSLKNFQIFGNQISEIPDNIADLVSLEHLEIWDNPIKRISPEIKKLKNLKSMRIDDDYLSETDKQNLLSWLPNCQIFFQTRSNK